MAALQLDIYVEPDHTLGIHGSIPKHGTLDPQDTSGQLNKAPRDPCPSCPIPLGTFVNTGGCNGYVTSASGQVTYPHHPPLLVNVP